MALVIRSAFTREDELLAAVLAELNGRLDDQNLAANSLDLSRVARAGIDGSLINTGTITSLQLAADSVGSSEIAADAVGSSEIAGDTVGASELVESERIATAPATSFPGSPVDDQVAWIQNATMAGYGAVWGFKYNAGSGSSYKWEFFGGAPMKDEIDTAETCSSAPWVDITTVGPQVTVPLNGDFLLHYGLEVSGTPGVAFIWAAAPKIGSAATSSADQVVFAGPNPGGATTASSLARARVKTGLTSGDVIKLQYGRTSADFTAQLRFLHVLPIRCS